MSRKVLHLVTSDARRGAEVAAVALAEALDREGLSNQVRALAHSAHPAPLPIPALGPASRHPQTLRALRRAAAAADVVVAHGSDTLLSTAVATVGLRVPYIYQVIGDPEVWGQVSAADLRVGWPLRRAAAVAALWPGAAESIERRYRVEHGRTFVIGNGRDPQRFRPPTEAEHREAREALAVDDARPVVAWIGALSEEKQPLRAVDIASAAPDLAVVIVGDGPLRQAVDDAAASARAEGAAVTVIGAVDDTASVLRAADALVVTSRTEGVPGVVVEAALTARPVVAPDVGGLSSVVGPATGAIVAADADAKRYAEALRSVIPERDRLGADARRQAVAQRSIEVVARRWAERIESVARQR